MSPRSDVLVSLEKETAAILAGNGFIHRDISLTAPGDAETVQSARRLNMTQSDVARERDRAYCPCRTVSFPRITPGENEG